jgi:hypothetical protein
MKNNRAIYRVFIGEKGKESNNKNYLIKWMKNI